ncbi:MAG: hypothetical protein KBD63_01345 [Bacteriovoracaceae bacterium]|nr:hypothetical protein [Bacteriovoracaceae bacterium]
MRKGLWLLCLLIASAMADDGGFGRRDCDVVRGTVIEVSHVSNHKGFFELTLDTNQKVKFKAKDVLGSESADVQQLIGKRMAVFVDQVGEQCVFTDIE